ncbi:MAG: hypothetical protein RIK87_06610 [Fuerstiella sp.]
MSERKRIRQGELRKVGPLELFFWNSTPGCGAKNTMALPERRYQAEMQKSVAYLRLQIPKVPCDRDVAVGRVFEIGRWAVKSRASYGVTTCLKHETLGLGLGSEVFVLLYQTRECSGFQRWQLWHAGRAGDPTAQEFWGVGRVNRTGQRRPTGSLQWIEGAGEPAIEAGQCCAEPGVELQSEIQPSLHEHKADRPIGHHRPVIDKRNNVLSVADGRFSIDSMWSREVLSGVASSHPWQASTRKASGIFRTSPVRTTRLPNTSWD